MVLVSSTTRIHSMLLLLLMLFHQGLQAPRPVATYRSTRTLNCSSIAKEIEDRLSSPQKYEPGRQNNSLVFSTMSSGHELSNDEEANLKKTTLRRVNLYEFLKSQGELDPEDTDSIKSNLQKLKCCLPASVNDSKLPGVFIQDLSDFRKKLRFYVIHLRNLPTVLTSRPPQPISGSLSPNPGTVEC